MQYDNIVHCTDSKKCLFFFFLSPAETNLTMRRNSTHLDSEGTGQKYIFSEILNAYQQ